MSFRTKVDMSNNRQLTQYIETRSVLSGATQFGVLFSQLPTGPNPLISGTSTIGNNLISTFSGDSGSTIFTWYDNRMELGHTRLSAITPSNSATTQNTGNVWTGQTSTTIDDNSLFLTYSGVSFDTNVIAMTVLGANSYSGSINSVNVLLLTASTLDFTGRTIWCDVSGFTRTNELIITKTPTLGYVWTCQDGEGRGYWSALGSGSTNYWSASTGGSIFGIVQNNSNSIALGTLAVAEGYLTSAGGNYSHTEGNLTTATGNFSHAEGTGTTATGIASHSQNRGTVAIGGASHAGGSGSTASGTCSFVHSMGSTAGGIRSAVIGGLNIEGNVNDTTYVPYLNISYSGTPINSGDTMGDRGAIRWDDTYFYLKTNLGWGRITLNYTF